MSEKLFYKLYWRPYVLLGVSMLLILISSLAPYLLPHAWLDQHIAGYYFYMFKTVSWLVKIALVTVVISVVRAFSADYFPHLEKLCTKQTNGMVSGYKKTWDRGSQLRPIIDFTVKQEKYSCAVNEAKGRKVKNENVVEADFALGLKKKVIYNEHSPEEFYLAGEAVYSRRAAMARYLLLLMLLILEAYLGIFNYILR